MDSSGNSAVNYSVLEQAHLNEIQQTLNRKLLEVHRRDRGRLDSLKGAILTLVVGESYERAKEELVGYVELKTAFPHFQERVQRHVQHCTELIQAIHTKRNFPGLATLSLAKQQEVHDKVLKHFDELKSNLVLIEKVEREQRLNDMRSTVWVLRTLCHAVTLILVVAFVIDIKDGMFMSFLDVAEQVVDGTAERIANFLGW